jgi:hypothetical protein
MNHTSNSTTASPAFARNLTVVQATPELFPLPQRGRDPYLCLGRSWYYDAERRGLLKLVRVRKPGNIRGKVFVPYYAARELMHRLSGYSSDASQACAS